MFIAYVKQAGEGCDYTIGCAQTLWRLKATTRIDAVEELQRKVGEVERLGELTLFEVVNEEEMPIEQWYTEAENRADERAQQAELNAERAELKRLKAKFE